jgi:hypothetical protein
MAICDVTYSSGELSATRSTNRTGIARRTTATKYICHVIASKNSPPVRTCAHAAAAACKSARHLIGSTNAAIARKQMPHELTRCV